jgi:Protease inhibitor Inh
MIGTCFFDLFRFMAFRTASIALLLSTTLLLAGCWSTDRPAAENTLTATGPAPTVPPVNMAGKWTLSAVGAGSCKMTFGATQADVTEGTIAPAGGCPFNFFTSRKWSYTTAGLTIRDHNAQSLAQLAPSGGDRFEGKTGAGQDIALSR